MQRQPRIHNGTSSAHTPILNGLGGLARNGSSASHDTFGALLLCGGQGTRMRDITHDAMPKALFEVGGKPLIRYSIDELVATKMIDRFAFAVDHLSEQMTSWITSAKLPHDVVIMNLPGSSIPAKVHAAAARLERDHIVIANSDEIRDYFALREALVQHLHSGAAATAVVTNPHNTVGKSILFDVGLDGKVKGAAAAQSLKPEEADSSNWLQHAGIMVLRKDAVAHLDLAHPDWDGGINGPLVRAGSLDAHINRDMVFFNVNSRSEIAAANDYLSSRTPV